MRADVEEIVEAVVGLFDDVLRRYRVEPDEILRHKILRHKETVRRDTYQAFDQEIMDTTAVR